MPQTTLNKIKLVIFDFDGTLADSFPWFIQSYNEVARKHHLKEIAPEQIASFRGHTVREMMQYVGMPVWKMPFVVNDFRSMMQDNLKSIRLFDGIDVVLRTLSEQGIALAIVSSNALDNIQPVLGTENTRLIRHFNCGVSVFGKADKLLKAVRACDVQPNEAVYLGDQTTDMEAAKKAGIACGAVSWGYNTIDALRQHGPDFAFDNVMDIIGAGGLTGS